MLSLKWDWSRARIWFDELPDWHYKGTEIIERQLESGTSDQLIHQSSAIELFVPFGGRFQYGALAMTFVPATAGPLVIQIPVLDSDDVLQDMLPGKQLDTVLVGILPSYANGIVEGLLNTVTARVLGAGTLSISGAAHGVIGSSPWVFKVLSRILVRLLTLDEKKVSDEQIIKLMGEEWMQARKMASCGKSLKSVLPA